jgi:acetyl-CoA carboxylase carboxyl transferase subunit beta
MVVHRHEMRPTLARLCRLLTKSPAPEAASKPAPEVAIPVQISPGAELAPAAPHA